MRRTNKLTKLVAAVSALFVAMIMCASPGFAAPKLNVSATSGLKAGQQITVSGSGFKAGLKQIAVGQCVKGYKGPSDCNLQGGATFRNADAHGSIGTFTLVLKEKWASFDCTKIQCVIAAAPLPTTEDAATVKANQVIIPISFGATASAQTTQSATPTTDTTTTTTTDTTTDEELVKTGAPDLPALALLIGGLLFAGGVLMAGARRMGGRV